MNSKYKTLSLVMAFGALSLSSLSSCSVFNSITGKKEVEKEIVLPQDREAIQQQATLKTFNPESLGRGEIKGDWAIEEVYGKKAVGETAPFLKFVADKKMVYGNNGCNTLNANYTFNPADSTLSFSHVLTTMMLCPSEGLTEIDINNALNATRYYSWELGEHSYYVYLYDTNHSKVMTLMHQNFAFLNGSWRVIAIDDTPMAVEDMELVIDVDEGKIHGNTGCNFLNGTLETDMEQPNSLSFQSIALTRRACPDLGDAETRFVVALEDASRAKPIAPGKVLFLDAEGNVVLTLERIVK